MKRFLSAGERCAQPRPPQLLILLSLVVFLLSGTSDQAYPQDSGRTFHPLNIGDEIPEFLWNMPLHVVNHPEGKKVIRLHEYRGATILLDFLSTGCSACIQALPKMEKVQSEFNGDMYIFPVTSQDREHVVSFLPKNKYTHQSSLVFISDDIILKQHFPHKFISHVVWISADGIVRAITGTNQVESRTVTEFRKGTPLDWPVKSESTAFFHEPLIRLTGNVPSLPNNAKRPLYYSMITGYTEGVGTYKPTPRDSVMGVERKSYRNRSILDLYLIAVDRLYKLTKDDIILEVGFPETIDLVHANLSTQTSAEWFQKNTYCYESCIPLGTHKETRLHWMLSDLNRFFGLNGRLENLDGVEKFILTQN